MALSVQKRQRISELLAQGHTVVQIAKDVGCSPGTVYGLRDRARDNKSVKAAVAEQAATSIILASPVASSLDDPFQWGEEIPHTIQVGLEYLERELQPASEPDHRMIRAVTAMISALSDAHVSAVAVSRAIKNR